MTHEQAIKKARTIADRYGQAALVAVADPAHGNGEGENRFDAVHFEQYMADKKGGRYLTLVAIVDGEVVPCA